MPGITPWTSASPRNVIPRITTQVPTTDVVTAASDPASSARCWNASSNGAVSQSMQPLRYRVVAGASSRSSECFRDPPDVGFQHPDQRIAVGPWPTERTGVQLDDLHVVSDL